jgi:hypothetical protein
MKPRATKQALRLTKIVFRMLDGRAKRLQDFQDIHEGWHKKTALRDLAALEQTEEFMVTSYPRDGERWWRCDLKMAPTKSPVRSKKCKGECQQTRSIDEFPPDRFRNDGRKGVCRDCMNKIARLWRARKGEKYRAQKREWWRKNKDRVNAQLREDRRIK